MRHATHPGLGITVHGMESSAPAIPLGVGLFLFPSDLIGGYRDLVLEDQGIRLEMELVFLDGVKGIAIGSCKEAGGVKKFLNIGQSLATPAFYINALTLPINVMAELPSPKEGMVLWASDDEGRIVGVQRVIDKQWVRFSITEAGLWVDDYVGNNPVRPNPVSEGFKNSEVLPLFQPEGVAYTLENMLEKMGFDPLIARRSRNAWAIKEGSAELHLAYSEEFATLCAEVHLVRISSESDKKSLLTFLLHENRHLTGYGFSIQGDLVVVALHIPAIFIREEVTSVLFLKLLKECDVYDNQLVSVYGAKWI